FAEESRPAYDRIHLGEVLHGRSAESLLLAKPEWYEQNRITLHLGDPVVSLDLRRRVVLSARSLELTYDRLVLATGSVPLMPPVKVDDWNGVSVLRTLDDVERARAAMATARRVVMIGGGLLGLETASSLHAAGLA